MFITPIILNIISNYFIRQWKKNVKSLFLSLGQVIKIEAPNNNELDNKIFMINYIDKNIVELIEQKNIVKKF